MKPLIVPVLALVARAGFPRLYAAAPLERLAVAVLALVARAFSAALCRGLIEATRQAEPQMNDPMFSAALCRGLIEATRCRSRFASTLTGFSAALCRGLIEARAVCGRYGPSVGSFPRLYAAASLKPDGGVAGDPAEASFSAALCRGLIEARRSRTTRHAHPAVFRGFMPRPH